MGSWRLPKCVTICACPIQPLAFLFRLDRFEKTNEMLLNFNNLSGVRMQQMNERFLHHTRTLVEMKKDLDSIFRRIRYVYRLFGHPFHQQFQSFLQNTGSWESPYRLKGNCSKKKDCLSFIGFGRLVGVMEGLILTGWGRLERSYFFAVFWSLALSLRAFEATWGFRV
uniref:KxDL motif-containing protein 1 n=1 Tax=Pseudonaja textilis TaxID=8673 RepID=A0A670Z6Q1_PSETE